MSRPSSYTSSDYGSVFESHRKPPQNVYIKTHKNITFSFGENASTFQHGNLGDTDTYLVGTVHLHYPRACAVKNVCLHIKGKEKTSWYKSQSRSKVIYTGEQTIFSQINKIWEAFEETEDITTLDIPFKIQLPRNLQETIITEMGSVQYVLCATVNTKGLLVTNSHTVKLCCPLKRTLILDRTLSSPYRLCGESNTGIEYTFLLPPHKYFNAGSHMSIPMTLRFLRQDVGVERLEITLKTLMDFSCSQNEMKHVEQQELAVIIELRSNNTRYPLGECTHIMNLFIPCNILTTCQGRFINISHQLSIKFCLWGSDKDFCVEEYVRMAHVAESNGETSALQSPFLRPSPSCISRRATTRDRTRARGRFVKAGESTERLITPAPRYALQDDVEYRRTVAPFDNRFNDEYNKTSPLQSPPQSPFNDIARYEVINKSDTFAYIQTPLSPPPYRRILTHQTSFDGTYS